MCTQSEAIAILSEAFERSKAVFGNSLVNAYLYGSFARGDYDDESDVDILLTLYLDREVEVGGVVLLLDTQRLDSYSGRSGVALLAA